MINHFGLDIGSDSIKVCQVSNENNSLILRAAGITKTPIAGFLSGSEKDLLLVAEGIKKIKADAHIESNEVIVSLPERHVFTQVFEFPKMSEQELSSAIPWEAENLIPKPLAEVNLDWEIIQDADGQNNNKVKVLLIASPKEVVEKYLKLLKIADLIPLSIETDILAIIRCLKLIINNKDILLLNLGLVSSDIVIVRKGRLFLTRSISTAGESITRGLSSSLGMEIKAAEEYKKTYGLSSQLEGKVAEGIKPMLSVISNELQKALSFYEEKEHQQIKQMMLTGGTSLMPDISEFFAGKLNIEVQVVNPFEAVGIGQQIDAGMKKDSPLFTVALGLALKEE